MITIAVVNESTVLSDEIVAGNVGIMDALRMQLTRDFCGAWNIDIPKLIFAAKGPDGSRPVLDSMTWVLALLDDSDQADALGYHDMSATGTPQGKAFVKSCLDDRESWSVCVSHELLEMLADPYLNLCAEGGDGRIRALEVCDPVEDDSLAYEVAGVLVSNFVTPAWFSPGGPLVKRYDQVGRLHQAGELGAGGYAQIMHAGNWTQINADDKARRKRPMRRGSRRERRVRTHRERSRAFGESAGLSRIEE